VLQARVSKAWLEQCWLIAALAVVAVVLNALTTGDHLARTLSAGYWPVAGVDLMLLVWALVATLSARKLRQSAELPTEIAGLENALADANEAGRA